MQHARASHRDTRTAKWTQRGCYRVEGVGRMVQACEILIVSPRLRVFGSFGVQGIVGWGLGFRATVGWSLGLRAIVGWGLGYI